MKKFKKASKKSFGQRIPKGYHRRASGAGIGCFDHHLVCDVCGRSSYSLTILCRDWPKDEDIAACSQCVMEYDEIERV